jgi:hypothetical protein
MRCTGKAGCAGHEAAPDVDLLLTHDESAIRHYGLVRDLSIPAQMFLLCFLVPICGIAIIQFPYQPCGDRRRGSRFEVTVFGCGI